MHHVFSTAVVFFFFLSSVYSLYFFIVYLYNIRMYVLPAHTLYIIKLFKTMVNCINFFLSFLLSSAFVRAVFAMPQHPDEYNCTYSSTYDQITVGAESRIVCPKLCGRSYKRMEHLKRHISYECGVEPKYKCHVCHRKFVYNFSMKKHMGLVHKDLTVVRP
jgi:hypothetical protein